MKALILTTPNDGVKMFVNPQKINYLKIVTYQDINEQAQVIRLTCTEIGIGFSTVRVLETPEEIIEKIKELKMNTEFIV